MGYRNRPLFAPVLLIAFLAPLFTSLVNVSKAARSNHAVFSSCPNLHLYSPMYHDLAKYVDTLDTAGPNVDLTIKHPVILWWTPFTKEKGKLRKCGNVKCFFTEDRRYWKHPQQKIIVFYGTGFNHSDLPLPRRPEDEWALLHEESPHNVFMYSHEDVITLFNHTSTFKRESDYPISTQWLTSIADLESQKYLVPTEEKNELRNDKLALVNYVQSDCGAYSDRDTFVKMLQEHISVDSYGACLHNKDLPNHLNNPLKGMDHQDFYKLLAQYKFTIAMENAVCDDYMTEKFWRPFLVGSVPIMYGSSKAKEFLPSNKSAIMVTDYDNIKDIVDLIKFLDENDEEYEKYLDYKRTGVDNQNLISIMKNRGWTIGGDLSGPHYIPGFECFLCQRAHESHNYQQLHETQLQYTTTKEHYGCPKPRKFSNSPPGNLQLVEDDRWASAWTTAKYMAMTVRENVLEGKTGSEKDFYKRVMDLYRKYEH